jgi:hypothetical protein
VESRNSWQKNINAAADTSTATPISTGTDMPMLIHMTMPTIMDTITITGISPTPKSMDMKAISTLHMNMRTNITKSTPAAAISTPLSANNLRWMQRH